MPKVSVIVPVYNVERYLRECLDSVMHQTESDIEIICVDDGSTDASSDILRAYARRDARITLIRQENKGVAAARNRGMDAATGNYLLFLDSDDFLELSAVQEAYAQCVNDDADICVFKIRYLHPDRGVKIEADWSLRMQLVPDHRPFAPEDMGGHLFRFITPTVWNKMFRRAFLARVGLRSPEELKRAEDLPFSYAALATAEKITVLDRALVNYRKENQNSLQATIHVEPLEIIKALMAFKRTSVALEVFDRIERDFVNAALEQVLYTLEELGTSNAGRALYDYLKSAGFGELGIHDHDEEYFFNAARYAQYSDAREQDWDEYLFGYTRLLRRQLERMKDWQRHTRAELERSQIRLQECETQMKEARQSLLQKDSTLSSLQETLQLSNADLEGCSRKLSEAMVDLDASQAQISSLQRGLDEIHERMLADVWILREQLQRQLDLSVVTADELSAVSAKITKVRSSRAYRLGCKITALPRKFKKSLSDPSKVN